MSNLIVVGISDLKITSGEGNLITYALGSCVGTCLYDKNLRIAGLSHILLPERSAIGDDANLMKYADTAIELLIREMERVGASRLRMTAKIAGGAKMFGTTGIGDRNILSVRGELQRLRIPLIAEDTGSNYGRTVEFHAQDGSVLVKSALHGVKTI